jgi:hypothetical protein
MSKNRGKKDKGGKKQKKAPADKSTGKGKAISAYKAESKSGHDNQAPLDVFVPKSTTKSDGK